MALRSALLSDMGWRGGSPKVLERIPDYKINGIDELLPWDTAPVYGRLGMGFFKDLSDLLPREERGPIFTRQERVVICGLGDPSLPKQPPVMSTSRSVQGRPVTRCVPAGIRISCRTSDSYGMPETCSMTRPRAQ